MSKKHFTKEDLAVMDPLSDDFYNYWSTTAQNNTEIYRSVFRCVPDDNGKYNKKLLKVFYND